MSAPALLRAPLRPARAGPIRLRTRGWPDRSRACSSLGDTLGWALDDEAAYVSAVAQPRRIPARGSRLGGGSRGVRSSSTRATSPPSTRSGRARPIAWASRTSTAGPGHPASPSSTARSRRSGAIPRGSRACRSRTGRWRRSCSPPASSRSRVHRIPIGIELDALPARATPSCGAAARELLGLPRDAFVVGSFQKDGVGFGDGLEPKSIKGPDVLVEALEPSRTGRSTTSSSCSRGPPAATSGESSSGAACASSHRLLPDRDGLARPRTTPSTRTSSPPGRRAGRRACSSRWRPASRSSRAVPGRRPTSSSTASNGILVDVEDAAGLAAGLSRVHGDAAFVASLRVAARRTAEETSHVALAPRWEALLDGFAERADG